MLAKKPLLLLVASLFIVMIGFGITVPVLPFYVERFALNEGSSQDAVALHVASLTSIYPLLHFIFAPLWGALSDRLGRKPLLVIGIAGYAGAQLVFGLASSLWMLYSARGVGALLSAATLPAAAAYMADITSERDRTRGMAWLATAMSLGVMVGPVLGGFLSRFDLHLRLRFGHFVFDSFSLPFFGAAILGFFTFLPVLRWLPESLPEKTFPQQNCGTNIEWVSFFAKLRPLLLLAVVGQLALSLFEATFGLYAQRVFNYGPLDVAVVFFVCGMVMAVGQIAGIALLAGRVGEIHQICAGMGLMGVGIGLIALAEVTTVVLAAVALLSVGMALIVPNLAALISRSVGKHGGAALGLQSAANSFGQAAGSFLGGVLFVWQMNLPYMVASIVLLFSAVLIGCKLKPSRSASTKSRPL